MQCKQHIKSEVDALLNLKNNTLQNVPGTGETLLESNLIKRIFTVSPLEIKTYLNVSSSTDPKNANIEISLNKSALFGQLYHCGGIINSDGNIALSKGVGFTSSKGGTGVYNITFNSSHPSSTYLVSSTLSTNTRAYVSCSNLTTDSIRFNVINQNNLAADTSFHFQVFL